MGVVSRRWVPVESMGVVVRRYIDFLILHIPNPVVSALYCSIPNYCSFFLLLLHLRVTKYAESANFLNI